MEVDISTESVAIVTSLLALLAIAGPSFGQNREIQKEIVQGHPMYTGLEPGDIPPILEPEFERIEKAEDMYLADEPLIAVVDGDSAKAYSTWHLDNHEVVNDYINGKAITVTW